MNGKIWKQELCGIQQVFKLKLLKITYLPDWIFVIILAINPKFKFSPHTAVVAIIVIIIWQGSPEVNLSVLIGSYLVSILPYRVFPWKQL